jgi:hypothetical protein
MKDSGPENSVDYNGPAQERMNISKWPVELNN